MAAPDGIDVHAHFFPEPFLRGIEEHGGEYASLDRSSAKGPAIVMGGGRTNPLEARYYDLDKRRRSMNQQGVRVQALSLTAPMVYWAPPEVGARLAQAWNDAASAACAAHPDRFVACLTLPMQDTERARVELERAARLPGMRGVYLGTNVNGRDLSDAIFFPVLERAAQLRLPVLLHPLTVVGAQRLQPFYLSNLLGNPFDTAVAAAHLIFGGVLDRLPGLTVCLPHAGGAFPYLFGRLRRGQRGRPETQKAARKPVHAYLRRFYYDTISHDAGALRYLVRTVGADRVSLGTDFCFDMGYERPRQIILDRAVGLTKKEQALVLHGSATRLLGLRQE